MKGRTSANGLNSDILIEKQYLLPLIDIDEENPFLNSKKY